MRNWWLKNNTSICKKMKYSSYSKNIKNILYKKKKDLFSFYNINYPRKKNFLKKNWKWLYRINFSKFSIPKIFLINKKIISHSGYIPFYIQIKNKKNLAAWFVDFIVAKNYRDKGIGHMMAKLCIKNIDICLTFCNAKSIKIFKDNKWNTDYNFFSTIIPIRPFKYKKLSFFLENPLDRSFFYLFSKINNINKTSNSICLERVNSKNINKLYDNYNSVKLIKPLRNKEYFKWRVLNSPFVKKYFIAFTRGKKDFFLLKKNEKNGKKYLEILTKPHDIEVGCLKKFIMEIRKWAYTNNYVYIKFLMEEKQIKKVNLFLIYKKKLNFAYFLKKNIKKPVFHFDLIDSDFEFTNF